MALGLFCLIALCSLPLLLYMRIFLVVGFSLFFWAVIWRRFLLKTDNSVVQLRYTDVGWFIRCAGKSEGWQEVKLLTDSIVMSQYVFLRLSPLDRRWPVRKVYPVLIAADSVQPEQFRRLKVFLRFIY